MRMDCAQHVHTLLSSIINTVKGPLASLKCLEVIQVGLLPPIKFTCELKCEMIAHVVICNCSRHELFLSHSTTTSVCGVESVHDWSIGILDILKKILPQVCGC